MKSMRATQTQTLSPSFASDAEAQRLSDRVKAIQESIARRAYEFFEERDYRHGYDLEDWLRAESEILLPIGVKTYDFEDRFITRAQVPMLTAEDIRVSIEQRRIVISDKQPDIPDIADIGDATPSRRLLCTVVLPESIDWANAAMAFTDGILEVEVPKLSKSGFDSAVE